MKRCKKCGVRKSLSDFYKSPGTRDGLRGECRDCNLAAQAAKNRAHPEANRRRVREWQLANPERVAAKAAEYRASGKKSLSDRKSYLKRTYNLTIEEYDGMLARQGGGCAICGRPPRPDISLHVDHDHGTGRIRGLLCFRCNNLLGDVGDDPQRLRAAAAYLCTDEFGPEISERIQARLDDLKRFRDGRLFVC